MRSRDNDILSLNHDVPPGLFNNIRGLYNEISHKCKYEIQIRGY